MLAELLLAIGAPIALFVLGTRVSRLRHEPRVRVMQDHTGTYYVQSRVLCLFYVTDFTDAIDFSGETAIRKAKNFAAKKPAPRQVWP